MRLMEFTGDLDPAVSDGVNLCDRLLTDPARLEALRQTELMDTETEQAFDRVARSAALLLKVPLTIISLVGDKRQFFKAGHGLPPPYDVVRGVPIDQSICRYTLQNKAIIASNARNHELLKYHPTVNTWDIVAFLAIPMTTDEGHVLGAFCAVDNKVREWSDEDLMIMHELTASVMSEINLRRQIGELRAERALREKFVMTLSHDLRNPLNVAKMAAQIIADGERIDGDTARFVKMIGENVDRADEMIQDLLNASRLKAGEKILADSKQGDLFEILRCSVEALRSVYGKRFEFCGDGRCPGHWDAKNVRRIIDNLVGNAVKYGDVQKPITIALHVKEDGAEISVHNWGQPISPGNLETIFDLFQRSEAILHGPQQGWGIGLTVVRSLAEDMRGRLSVTSNEEEGTTFAILLPVSK